VKRASIRRIVYATDFSRASRRAGELAQELTGSLKAELILCHVYGRVVPVVAGSPAAAVPPELIQEIWEREKESAGRRLSDLATSMRRGGVRVSTRLVSGTPARGIVDVARRVNANLLVLGTRGRTGIKRFLLGSVAERVVRTARCPVVTVGPARRG
jgi:nucleotide-binding universal stress UspA family protein